MYNEFSKDKIEHAGVENWSTASVSELYRQKNVLSNRLMIAHSLGKVPIIKQLTVAIAALDEQIRAAQQRPSAPLKRRSTPGDSTSVPTPSFD